MPSGTRPLETERLRLRRFTTDDAEAMYRTWANDPEVTRWMTWDPHQDADETRDILAQWEAAYQSPGYYHWAITLADGTLIGSLGILPSRNYDTGMEPGYCIARPYWNKGYTTEALAAALDYYIADTGDVALRCCHAAGNPASGRVMEKCGFVYRHDGTYSRLDGTVLPAKFYEYAPETRKE